MQKLQQDHYFMKVSLTFERPLDYTQTLNGRQLKAIIIQALQSLHGQVGAAIPVDVLKCSQETNLVTSAILRMPHNELVKVWSALTLLGTHRGRTCAFQVHKVSASLMSLAENSREFVFSSPPEEKDQK